jgi:hypothetical protein
MTPGSEETVAFRLWPPVAIGAPLLAGGLATLLWGDPVTLGGWRVPLGWALVLFFAGVERLVTRAVRPARDRVVARRPTR